MYMYKYTCICAQLYIPGSNLRLFELKPVLVLPLPLPPEEGGGLMEKFPLRSELSVLRCLVFGLRLQSSKNSNIQIKHA